MNKLVSLTSLIVGTLIIVVIGIVVVYFQPSPQRTAFQRDNASQDTTSFTEYSRGTVVDVLEEEQDDVMQSSSLYQRLSVELTSGPNAGTVVETEFTQLLDAAGSVRYASGDAVVLGTVLDEYVIVDRYRLNHLYLVVGAFMVLAVLIGRRKGLLSLIGLVVTGAIVILFIAPQLLAGKDPVTVSLLAAGLIAVVTMTISHGFSIRTRLSIISTLVSLLLAAGLSILFVYTAQLFGLGQSDAFLLESGFLGGINLRGILLAGIIISLLGVLDDVTTAQTATVAELSIADPSMGFKQLYRAGMTVGREHIASLINTLVLVYAGASLPLFLLLTAATTQPLWVLLNSEYLAEEIVRAVVGSIALILAVPISTVFASYWYARSSTETKNT